MAQTKIFSKSHKLDNVLYDIRGPVLEEAKRLESEGFNIIKLNTGNPAAFGFTTPEEIVHDIVINSHEAMGYGDSQGIFAARKAVMHDFQSHGIMDVTTEDVFIGNGVSELITMSMQALLNDGDEVLIPSPDYPLWTASVTLAGGKAVHYLCDESADWNPCIEDMAAKVSAKTKAIVIINPNNPTGAVYSKDVLEQIAKIAAEHNLIVFADEIYDRILYDDAVHIPFASVNPDVLTVCFNGLSKSWRAAGFRAGWMVFSGNKSIAKDYKEGVNMLANMRLCANMLAQLGIQTALGGYQSIRDLILPGGRLREQRDTVVGLVNSIPGLSTTVPKGALYCFPKIDTKKFNIKDDEKFIMDLLQEEHLLLVHGRGFNWNGVDHFRIIFLPDKELLGNAMHKIAHFLQHYKQT
ncbi:MAG: pyridoxal phosphate-dependent aminotransferase [Spirochaetaceae bacterium]|jgi:alanine-synthesizing transaminase|nr:pyridoxal phosphate-dependent aminotransferase [Spirochaetaceae bacterium]